MIAGIAIDDWKLPIFEKHLKAAGRLLDGVQHDGYPK